MKVVNETINSIKGEFPKVYNEAMRLSTSKDPNKYLGVHVLDGGFKWEDSPQGWSFWHLMYTGQIEKAQNINPELF